MNAHDLIERLIDWTLLVVSLTVHEWSHAWSAYKLGDDTAERMGRLTFNPIVHMDLLGTVILPLLGAPIGWAKPVPIQPHRFRSDISMTWGMLLTAIAGPISNIVLAIIGTLMFAGATHLASSQPEVFDAASHILLHFILMNVALALFNLIPIPPLDGSRVVNHFLPDSMREGWHQFEQFGFYILFGLLMLLKQAHIDVLSGPILAVCRFLLWLASPLMA